MGQAHIIANMYAVLICKIGGFNKKYCTSKSIDTKGHSVSFSPCNVIAHVFCCTQKKNLRI